VEKYSDNIDNIDNISPDYFPNYPVCCFRQLEKPWKTRENKKKHGWIFGELQKSS